MLPKLLTTAELSELNRENKKLVFTNGCFDLLHEGHLYLLREAKKLGDILIVGLNSDTSVKILKGEERPVENETVRAQKLADLSTVDHIILFEEETPFRLIEFMKPDVLVKGGDYDENNIAGAAFIKSYGGKIAVIPLLEGYSTTNILANKNKPI